MTVGKYGLCLSLVSLSPSLSLLLPSLFPFPLSPSVSALSLLIPLRLSSLSPPSLPLSPHLSPVSSRHLRYGVDHSRLEGLGWKPSVDFEEGLRRTINWYRMLDPAYWKEFEYSLAGHPSVKLGHSH